MSPEILALRPLGAGTASFAGRIHRRKRMDLAGHGTEAGVARVRGFLSRTTRGFAAGVPLLRVLWPNTRCFNQSLERRDVPCFQNEYSDEAWSHTEQDSSIRVSREHSQRARYG
jgi:hypothetical protein